MEAGEQNGVSSHQFTNKSFKLKLKNQTLLYIGIAGLILAAVAIAGFFYFKYQEAIKISDNIAGVNTGAENKKLIDMVGKIVELPENEVPTIATVSDINELAGQEFFKNAANGDRVLIYNQAKLAYLYRPSSGKIINIGPVNIPQEDIQGAATNSDGSLTGNSDETIAKARVIILNGTSIAGILRSAESLLEDIVDIVARDNAKRTDYEEVLVVDVSGGAYRNAAQDIANTLNGGLSAQMPTGEDTPPDVDIVVILGSNYGN